MEGEWEGGKIRREGRMGKGEDEEGGRGDEMDTG